MQITQCMTEAFKVGANVVFQPVLREKDLDVLGRLRMPELGHRREEMVLDLEVEPAHPPIAHDSRTKVRRVVRTILDPMHELIGVSSRQVSMREGTVREDIHRGHYMTLKCLASRANQGYDIRIPGSLGCCSRRRSWRLQDWEGIS